MLHAAGLIYALMVGGSDADVARVMPIFNDLKPAGEFGFTTRRDRRSALRAPTPTGVALMDP